ncbi:MAG: alanine--tRNA ligase-related protein, partial [Caulobacterales bacterium]
SCLRLLVRGMDILADADKGLSSGAKVDGAVAFKLYDTYGFPLDLTEDILRARDITVDNDGFTANMEAQRDRARAAWSGSGDTATDSVWLTLKDKLGGTEFLGYVADKGEGKVLAIISGGAEKKELKAGETAELLFDHTPFYAESGGQAGDQGRIEFGGAVFDVEDTQKRAGALHAHGGKLISGSIKLGDKGALTIDRVRRNQIRANHSATHLLHAALRRNLGPHVTQKGSLVEADRFRFDFSHNAALSRDELDKIEAEVNAVVRQNEAAHTKNMKPQEAIEAGAMALFGEKYGDEVRVLTLGHALDADEKPYSVELCGGTHVSRTGDIALFTILSESAVAAGVRRIEGTTGAAALDYLKKQASFGRQAADELKTTLAELPERVGKLSEERRKFERELADTKKKLAMAGPATGGAAAGGEEIIAGVKVAARVLDGVAAKDLRGLVDDAKKSLGSGIVAFIGVADGKAALTVGVTSDLTDRFSAVDLVRAGSAVVGGQGGGGRPDMAQAGGPDGAKADAALAAIKDAVKAKGQ